MTFASPGSWLLVAATLLAFWLRISGLAGWDGTLSVDEARLALAGRGILDYGLPVLPSGWLYTRGLLASYLVAPSLAVIGQTDFAARLPSVLAGTALVPVMYGLGRAVAGSSGGLFAALIVAGYSPLVIWSRQSWFYALYVLIYFLALLFVVRAHQHGRTRDQILAGGLVGLSFFAHELGVLLIVPLGAQIVVRLQRDRVRGRVSFAALGALALATGAGALLWLLVTNLRAETLVGAYGEVTEYFSPHLEGAPFRFYGRMLVDGRGLVLALALVGIPLALRRRRGDALILWLALLPPFVHAVTMIPDQPQERYGLTFFPVLAVLAAQSVSGWSPSLVQRLPRLSLSPCALASLVLAVILAVHQDVGRALDRGALSPREGGWLREARALSIGPDDLVMSDLPTVTGWYLDGPDFWVSSRDYQKYTVLRGDVRHDVHTGAILVRSVADFRRLVAQPNPGRTLWVIASGRSYQWGELVDDDLKALLERAATRRVTPGDGSRILQIPL